jgi:hypothetical protein
MIFVNPVIVKTNTLKLMVVEIHGRCCLRPGIMQYKKSGVITTN